MPSPIQADNAIRRLAVLAAAAAMATAGAFEPPIPAAAPRVRAAEHATRQAAIDPAIATAASHDGALVPVLVALRGAPDGPALAPPGRSNAADALASRRATFEARSAGVLAALADAQARGEAAAIRPLWAAHAVAAHVAPRALAGIAAEPAVKVIALDHPFVLQPPALEPSPAPLPSAPGQTATAHDAAHMDDEPLPGATDDVDGVLWNIDRIGASDVWRLLGVDGRGASIAIFDSGVDYHHPLLTGRYRGYFAGGPPRNQGNWWCKAAEDALCGFGLGYPVDGLGHGTHVAGTALAGDGVGVAPGARWMALRVCATECRNAWLVEALQWLLEQPVELLPDVLNASLSTDEELMTLVLKPLLDALVEAGVVVVASTGNGPGPLGAPAVLPSAIGVGATTPDGALWKQSRSGRTAWGQTKPDLLAPGTAVTSTIPGGGRIRLNGTSMASPHVAGVAALLRSADPSLSPAQIKTILMETATPVSDPGGEGAAGHGQVNAYAALLTVTDAGTLRGRIARAPDGAAIPWGRARVSELDGDPIIAQDVDETGAFEVGLSPGEYLVIAEAFGYRTETRRGIVVRDGDATVLPDFLLPRDDPTGILAGDVADASTGAPLEATVRLEGVPFAIASDAFGLFDRQLPARTYSVRVERFGYRVLTDTVKIGPDETVRRIYRLQPAPRILLVDGDAWAYSAAVDSYRSALARLGYIAHEHAVTDDAANPGRPGGPPDAAKLADYDIVIWASSLSGPAFVRGASPLSAYLTAGGRLLVAGQDAMCVDAGIEVGAGPCALNARPHPYVRNQLFLRVRADNAYSLVVRGSDGGPLEGITLTLNGPDSLANQTAPDVLEVTDALFARPFATYGSGGDAAVLVDRCTTHRAIALGFGLEGVTGAADRDRVLGRLIDALMAEPPARGVFLRAREPELVRPPGFTADYTMTVTSTGTGPEAFQVAIASAGWPAELWTTGFTAPLTGTLSLQRCQTASIGVRVSVPREAERGQREVVEVEAQTLDGAVRERLALAARAPAPVLVVDGDFVADSEARYHEALDALGVPFDTYALGRGISRPVLPSATLLAQYPVLVWFTGYDFRPNGTLDIASQQLLAGYLDAGGRLLFASEDYLRSRGAVPYAGERLFHRDYLGVFHYDDDAGGAQAGPLRGADGSLLAGLEGCVLAYPGRDYSDRLHPRPEARATLLNRYDQPVGVQLAAGRFRTLFLALDAGLLDARCAETIHARALDWFGPLADSTLRLVNADGQPESRRTFAAGDSIFVELTARTDGTRGVDNARIAWSIPEGAEPDLGSLPPGWTWDVATRTIAWRGTVATGRPARARLGLRLDADLPQETTMVTRAEMIGDGLAARREASWRVNAPDLAGSTKTASPDDRPLDFGSEVTFAITVRNDGTRDAAFSVTDTLPAGLRLTPDSWYLSDGSGQVVGDPAAGTLRWQGSLAPRRVATLQYRTRVVSLAGGIQRNHAELDDGTGVRQTLSASVLVKPRVLLPWLGAEIVDDP